MKRGVTGREVTGRSLSIDSVLAIWMLEGDKLYPSFSVARGLFTPKDQKYQLLRKRLNLFIQYHTNGAADGKCGRFKAWRGSTWQSFLEDADLERAFEVVSLNDLLKKRLKTLQSLSALPVTAPAPQPAVPSEKKKTDRVRTGFGFKRIRMFWVAAITMTIFSLATTAFFRPEAYDILRSEGLRAALAHIAQRKSAASPETLFNEAWIHYRDNDFSQAKEKVAKVLESRIPVKLKGDCFYLLGYLHIGQGAFNEALSYFREAHAYYLVLDRPDLLYLSYLALARSQTSLANYHEANALLDQALDHYQQAGETGPWGAFHAQRARVLIGLARYASALDSALKSAEAFEQDGDNDGLANAYSDLGFLYQLNGDFEQAYAFTIKAQTLIVHLGDPNRHYFNLINFILMDRCRGLAPATALIDAVETWARQSGDEELMYFLELALDEDCPTLDDESRPDRPAGFIETRPLQ